MRIKEFFIQSYGPLKIRGKRELTGFNLFWGENEEGKTLTIEALLKLLFQKAAKKFEKIERVEEKPEGYVILETRENLRVKFPEAGSLPELAGISAEEADNIFVIRNSRLSIAREEERKKNEESRFYTSLTDRLTGLRTEKIEAIKNKLKDLGKLTAASSTAGLSNDQRYGKVKAKRNKADELYQKIMMLLDRAEKEDIEKKEQSLVRLEDELRQAEEMLDRLGEARLRDSYLKAKEIFEKIKSSQRTLQGLSFFTEEERNSWWEWQTEMERVKETENYLQEKAGVIQEELQKTEETLKKAEREFKELERKKERINQGLRLELENYERDEQACQRKEANAKEINKLIKIALVVSGLTALAYIVHPVKVISVPLIGGILLAGFLFILFLKANWCRSRVDQLWISLQKESSLTGIPASSPKELWEKFAFIDESWRQKANILNDLRVKDKHLRTNLEEIEKKELTEIKQKLKGFQRKIEEVKLRSRVESLEIYSQNLKQKQEIENRIKVWRNSLAHIFPGQEKGKEDKLLFWGEKLKKLEGYKEKARGIDFNEKKREEEKNRKDNLRLKIEEIRQQMKTFRKELSEVEREINSLELENEFIPVETTVDLRAVEEKLVNFRVELDRQTEAVLDTLKVFEEIEAEEKSKIAALFGKKSPVSEIFFMVTKGRYNQVVFDQEIETIKVALNNEEWLLADQLSAGAYDQLYFSIRLALGKILLENEKGFFILDDPFIKADPRRLETQMNVLRQIVNQGWQVLYFSAKGEIKECLKKDIEKTFVRLFQV